MQDGKTEAHVSFRVEDDRLVGDTGSLRIALNDQGGIARLDNLVTGQAIVDAPEGAPWRLTPQGVQWRIMPPVRPPSYREHRIEPTGFAFSVDGAAATLTWETSEPGVTVEALLRLSPDGSLALRPRVLVEEGVAPPLELTFPILSEPRALSPEGQGDVLLFPAHSGWIVRDPLAQPPQSAVYPDGYHGASVQVMAYYADGVGGCYLAAHDPHSTMKRFHFDAQEWSVAQETWDLREGVSVDYEYDLVIAPLARGSWHEAADRYRAWALAEAPWCATTDDPGEARRDERSWLHEEVGMAIWGTPSSLDWSPWYRHYAAVAGTPLHICSGWDWPATVPHAVGREGWFPERLHPANVEAWDGHHVTPYTNDVFISTRAERFFEDWEPNLLFPYTMFPFVPFSQPSPEWIQGRAATPDPVTTTDVNFFLCPVTDALRDLHAWRAEGLMRNRVMAGACYDIGSGNPMLWSTCWRAEHGHAPGRGREVVVGYDRLNRNSRAAVRRTTGRYLVQGVEVIIENIIGSVDFYVARAGAGPVGALETWAPAPEAPPGTGRELAPLFEAIYHDVGPVRHDGWLTLAEDTGELFFWAAARIVLQWGGLLSLHYGNNPPEQLPDNDLPAQVVNWDGAVHTFDDLPAPDPLKAAFARELAAARTRLATPYLAHGRLLAPAPLDAGTVSLGFTQRFAQVPNLVNTGSWEVPAVVQGAWQAPGGAVGILLCPVADDRTLSLAADAGSLWDLDLRGHEVVVRTLDEEAVAGTVGDDNVVRLDVDLSARTVTLVEVRP